MTPPRKPSLGAWCDHVLERQRRVAALETEMLGVRLAGEPLVLADLRPRLAAALVELESAKAQLLAAETAGLPQAPPSRPGRRRHYGGRRG